MGPKAGIEVGFIPYAICLPVSMFNPYDARWCGHDLMNPEMGS